MKEKFILIAVFLISLIFYTLTLKGVAGNPKVATFKSQLEKPTGPFELSNERDRYLLMVSLVFRKTFALSKYLADIALPDVGYYRGNYFIYFPPGVSLLVLPVYYLGLQFGYAQLFSYFAVSFFASVSLLFLYKICRNIINLPVWSSVFAVLVFAFSSTSWSYAVTLYQHHITDFLLLSSFYAVWKYKQKKKTAFLWAFIVWFNYAYSILVDYPNAILLFPVIIYFFLSSFRIDYSGIRLKFSLRVLFLVSSFVFAGVTVLHGYYNWVYFGSPLRVSGSLVGYSVIKSQNLLKTGSGQNQLQAMEAEKTAVGLFSEENLPRGLYTLLIAPDKGILIFSPIFLLSVLGIFYSLRKTDTEKKVLLSVIIVNIFLYAGFGDPWGGWAFGPRYLIPTMAVASIFAAVFLNRALNGKKSGAVTVTAAFLLFILSAGISLIGALTTNAVPPKIEADFFHMKYGFLLNLDFLRRGESSSFVYNHFLSGKISLLQYYFLILTSVAFLAAMTLFVLPELYKNKKKAWKSQ